MKWIILFVASLILVVLLVAAIVASEKPKLYVVTVITDPQNTNFLRLYNTALINQVNFVPLLSTHKIGHGDGFGMKIKMLSDFIQTKQNKDLVMFVDGYDVLLVGNEGRIIEEYSKLKTQHGDKAFFSAEYYCWPDNHLAEKYPKTEDSPYRFLNSGTYISSVKTLRKILGLTEMDIHSQSFQKFDDQRFYTQLYLDHDDLIVLDTHNRIFNCMAGAIKDLELKDNRWYNKVTNTYPLVFHGNGGTEIKDFLFTKIYPSI